MVVSFIGHRDIEDRGGVYKKIRAVMRELIVCRAAEVFLFGSRSDFDSLCVKAAKELKSEFPHIKRIYIRAEYPIAVERLKTNAPAEHLHYGIDRMF